MIQARGVSVCKICELLLGVYSSVKADIGSLRTGL